MVFITLFFTAISASACSVSPDFKVPTLAENFKQAQKVFFGIVDKKIEHAGEYPKFRMKVEKSWKGEVGKAVDVLFEPPDTCDGFGSATVGEGCIVFLNQKDEVISGIATGDSSFCIPKDAPRLKTLASEYDSKFKRLSK